MLFSVQCYLQLLGQHYTKFSLVQCCLKSIMTTLNRNFSCAMLSGTSWATLHTVFTCAMLTQGYLDNIEQNFCLEALGQHCTRLLPVQYCRKRIKATLNIIFSCVMLSVASRTTLPRGFTCAILSQKY